MTEIEKFLFKNKSELKKVLDLWKINSSDKDEFKQKIKSWLSNKEFQTESSVGNIIYEEAFQLLKYIDYNSLATIYEKNKANAAQILPMIKSDISTTFIFPLGESSADGGTQYIKTYTEELSIEKSNANGKYSFNYSFFTKKVNVRNIILVDDFIGSGDTITKFISRNIKAFNFTRSNNIKVYLVCLYCNKDIFDKYDGKEFTKIIASTILDSRYKIFNKASYFVKENENSNSIKKWCQKIGKSLYSPGPLGYKDSQYLIAFENNTPNNTLPIIWAGNDSESMAGVKWIPLFPRKKPKTIKRSQILNDRIIPKLFSSKIIDANDLLYTSLFIQVRKLLLWGVDFSSLSFDKQIEIVKLEQKVGILNLANDNILGAHDHLDIMENNIKQVSAQQQTKFYILKLKAKNQSESFEYVTVEYKNVIKLIDKNLDEENENGLKCGVYHKAAIAFYKFGDYKKSHECIKNSLAISRNIKKKIPTSEATALMYATICQHFSSYNYDIPNAEDQIIQCSYMYFQNKMERELWKFNHLKSALQCLFCYSSMLLYSGEIYRAELRLVAVNMINSIVQANSNTEGFSELLNVYPANENHKLLLTSALGDQVNGVSMESQEVFLNRINNSHLYIDKLKKTIPKFINNPTYTNWKNLITELAKADKVLSPL